MDIKKYKLSSLDSIIKQVNQLIGQALGVRRKSPLTPQKRTSNLVFIIILMLFIALVWAMTGFYYISNGQLGLIMHQGRIVNYIKGEAVGFTYPYPWGSVHNIKIYSSSEIPLITNYSVLINNKQKILVLSKDLNNIQITGRYFYRIIQPLKLYSQIGIIRHDYVAPSYHIRQAIGNELIAQLHKYASTKTMVQLQNTNLSIMSGTISNNANIKLQTYGVKVSLDLTALSLVESSPTGKFKLGVADQNLARQLIVQANNYRYNSIAMAKAEVNKYKLLLPLYQVKPKAIVNQMYYDALADIDNSSSHGMQQYPLLNLSLEQLQVKNEQLIANESLVIKPKLSIDSGREVNRFENLEQR